MSKYCDCHTEKAECPINYLNDLNNFINKNKIIIDEDGYSDLQEMSLSIENVNMVNNEVIIAYNYLITDGNIPEMIEDFKNKSKLSRSCHGSIIINEKDEEQLIEKMEFMSTFCKDNTTFNETRKGLFIILCGEDEEYPIFIDDIGLKIRLETYITNEIFDTKNYENDEI